MDAIIENAIRVKYWNAIKTGPAVFSRCLNLSNSDCGGVVWLAHVNCCSCPTLSPCPSTLTTEDTSSSPQTEEKVDAVSPPSDPAAVPPSPTSPGTKLQAWNPMEKDFLSARNIYKVDDEDASSALQGYSEWFVGL